MTSVFHRFSFFFAALFLFFSGPLQADFKLVDAIQEFGERRYVESIPTRLKAGPINFHPHLRSSATYDSNILTEDTDEREDVVYNIAPGALIEIPLDKHQLTVGYEADIEIFSKKRHSRQNDQNQNFFALVDLHFPSFYVNVLEQLSETSSRSGTTFTDRVPRIDQNIHPRVGYKWKRTTFETGFRHFARDFRRQINDSFDFQVSEWTQVLYYDLFARLKALLEYQIATIDYDDNRLRKGVFNQIRAGFVGELMPNLTADLRLGTQFRNYLVSSEKDFNSWVGDLIFRYHPRQNIKLELFGSRDAVEATFFEVNFYKQYRWGATAEYEFRPKWTLFGEFRQKRHDYAERATLEGQTGYRRDQILDIRSGLRYDLQEWLELELVYEFLRRDSNFPSLDYTDHRVSLASHLKY